MENISPGKREELLTALYDHHSQWLSSMPLACKKGCATCCTQSVTMTGLEGLLIIAYLKRNERFDELEIILAERTKSSTSLPLTTNEFAEYCLKGIEPEEPVHEEWDFTPCPFLQNDCCSIYPVRPFACRAFVSTTNCGETGSAEVTPLTMTINTAFTQLVEHLADGSKWGKMLDILGCYTANKDAKNTEAGNRPLRDAKPLPGLIVCEDEQKPVQAILGRFLAISLNGVPIRTLLKLEGVI